MQPDGLVLSRGSGVGCGRGRKARSEGAKVESGRFDPCLCGNSRFCMQNQWFTENHVTVKTAGVIGQSSQLSHCHSLQRPHLAEVAP